MNRILLFISFLFVSLHLLAIPAKPVKRTLQLSDGTQVETTLRGDYAADDGRNFVHRNGTFIPVDQKEISESWASQKKMSPRRGMSSKKRLPSINPSFCSGNKKGLVGLINFDDVKFTVSDPLALYKDFFNKKGYTDYGMHGSVHDYFYDQSYGKLNYTFDVVGPVQVSQPQAFYGQDDNENKRKDINWTQMVEEACKLVSADPRNMVLISPTSPFLQDEQNYIHLKKVVGKAMTRIFTSNDNDFSDESKNEFMAEMSEILYKFSPLTRAFES